MAALKSAKKELRTLMRKKLADVSGESIAEQSLLAAASLRSMPQYKAAGRVGVYLSMPKGELMTKAIVEDALAKNKKIFVPYLYKVPQEASNNRPQKLMDMASLHSSEDYKMIEDHRDAWGIPSVEDESLSERQKILDNEEILGWEMRRHQADPESTEERVDRSKIDLDLIVMPGMAFDRKCGRLGHGKGFYDLFLQRYYDSKVQAVTSENPPQQRKGMPFLVGLALNEQIMPVDQEVPTHASDWYTDAVVAGDGSIIERSRC